MAGDLIPDMDQENREESYWLSVRAVPLHEREAGIYEMVDSLKRVPQYKTFLTFLKGFSAGYVTAGPIDFGSLYSLFSFNDVEGARFRLGARTNGKFHPHWRLKGYAAYGTRDRRFKYSGSVGYAFDPVFSAVPRHYLGFTYEQDNRFPGQYLRVLSQDNFFLSFRTAPATKMVAYQFYRMDYHKEFTEFFSMDLHVMQHSQRPVGDLKFQYYDDASDQLTDAGPVRTTSAGISLLFAPHTMWWEGQYNRYPIPGRFPIISVGYEHSSKGILGSGYSYHHLNVGFRKRIHLGPVGYSVVDLSLGKVWGRELPYILLHVAEVNQSIAFHPKAFNVMNFLEFVGDEYLGFHLTHNFNGLLLNRIPLIKKLKWREVFGLKMYYSRLTDANNPNLNRNLIQFETTEEGIAETYATEGPPYVELSAGITNFFRFFEIHYVQRMNYLEHPNVPGLFGKKGAGIRVGFTLNF